MINDYTHLKINVGLVTTRINLFRITIIVIHPLPPPITKKNIYQSLLLQQSFYRRYRQFLHINRIKSAINKRNILLL